MRKVADGVTTTYVIAVLGLPHVLVETTGGQSTAYLYGHDLLAEEGTAWAWHLDDGLGSVRQLADDTGQVTLAQGYTPFGVLLWRKGSAASAYGFTGEQEDAAVGLVFLRARYYDPYLNRFISKDPWAGSVLRPGTSNGWVYVGNNPTNDVDPSGILSKRAIARCFGKDSFADVLKVFEANGRWGFLALLLDADFGNTVGLARLAPLGHAPFGLVPMRPDETLRCESGCAMIGDKPLSEYLARLDRGQLNYYDVPPHWWREEVDVYKLNGKGSSSSGPAYIDWKDYSEIPDFAIWSVGLFFTGAYILDRYGNEYWSVGGGFNVGVPIDIAVMEGYATKNIFRRSSDLLNESQLRDVIEGYDVSISAHLVVFGGDASLGEKHSGTITFVSKGLPGVGISASYAWWVNKDQTLAWDWIDRVGFTRADILNKIANENDMQDCNQCDY